MFSCQFCAAGEMQLRTSVSLLTTSSEPSASSKSLAIRSCCCTVLLLFPIGWLRCQFIDASGKESQRLCAAACSFSLAVTKQSRCNSSVARHPGPPTSPRAWPELHACILIVALSRSAESRSSLSNLSVRQVHALENFEVSNAQFVSWLCDSTGASPRAPRACTMGGARPRCGV